MKKTWFLPEQWDKFYAVLCSGASFSEAARVAGVSRNGAAYQWRKTGGMTLMMGIPGGLADPPTSVGTPGTGRLSLVERATIMVRLRDGKGHAEIGRELGRDRTVIWREIKRNTNPDSSYQADLAHARAHQRAHRPKAFKLTAMNHDLLRFIEDALEDGWSPKLISLVLAKDYADDKSMQISHETIYQCLYVQSRGELRKDLYRYLSLSRPKRVSRENQHAGGRAKPYRDALKIASRPAEAEDRAVPGHWEGDLIIGAGGKSAIGTLVERSTRFTILLHLPERHTADAVAEAMITAMGDLPAHLRRSVTWDRGTEMSGYDRIQLELQAPVYFCDPHSPWQRGTNENTNRLLRHWFAKSTDLSGYTAEDLKTIQDKLNRRPRPTLDLQTPAQALNQMLQQAA